MKPTLLFLTAAIFTLPVARVAAQPPAEKPKGEENKE
ncbi:MAG: hypothetical protein JWL81_1838, partial [Verrucomicrobiales bacterium]|nr:hypothetical protein [Verrucomicrobiales bacterium]